MAASMSDEIVVEILRRSEFKDIVRCREVCRNWKQIIESSTLLLYLVWLGIHETVDGDPSFEPNSSSERLQLLLDHERAWTCFAPRSTVTLKIEAAHLFPSRLGGGKISSSYRKGSLSRIRVDELPSLLSRTDLRPDTIPYNPIAYTNPELGIKVATDVGYDLVVQKRSVQTNAGWTVELHFVSMHNPHQYHSLARRPVIVAGTFSAEDLRRASRSDFAICGPLLLRQGYKQFESQEQTSSLDLGIWNWISGALLCSARLPCSRLHNYTNVSLLSAHSFAVPVRRYDSTHSLLALDIEVYDFDPAGPPGDVVPRLRHTLGMPEVRRDTSLSVELCSDPLTTTDASGLPTSPKPFHDVGESMCTMALGRALAPDVEYRFFWHIATLLTPSARPTSPHESIPWEAWGAMRAACFYGTTNLRTDRHPHGSRALMSLRCHPSDALRGRRFQTRLLDFAENRVRRFANPVSWPMIAHEARKIEGSDNATSDAEGFTLDCMAVSLAPGEPILLRGTQALDPIDQSADIFVQSPVQANLPFLCVSSGQNSTYHPTYRHQRTLMDSERVILAGDYRDPEGGTQKELCIMTF